MSKSLTVLYGVNEQDHMKSTSIHRSIENELLLNDGLDFS